MDYKKAAAGVLESIGGKENIISAAHCATRLRLVIADNGKVDKKTLENAEGVQGVFEAQGQLQIIFGTGTVNKVYDEFIAQSGAAAVSKDEAKAQGARKGNWFQRAIKTLGDIFVPIIPAIVASGFLMGIMESLKFMVNNGFIELDSTSSLFVFADLFSNVAYTFLPILIAFSAAKVFGGNPFLGAVVGMIMIHPSLQNAWTVADGVQTYQEVFFGLYEVPLVGYQGHVIPVIIAVWVMCFLEKRLHKIVPPMFDLFVTPLVSVFVTGYLTLAAIGPLFTTVENFVIDGVQWLIAIPFGIGSFIMGGLYATTVVSGIHHMYTIIDLGQLSAYGLTFWLPLASAANVAQGGAALAVAIKTRNKKLKSMALPASLSAFMGITEPAIFGVNLRFFRPFIAGAVGGACGALYASIVGLGATGTGVTGIFGILLHLHHPIQYILTVGIAAGVAFALSWIMGIPEEASQPQPYPAAAPEAAQPAAVPQGRMVTVAAPLTGEAVPLSKTGDPAFAAEVLGKGVAVKPAENRIYAPCAAEVTAVMGHAIGLQCDNGVELLIHVGIDTVNLNGKHYTGHVVEGQRVQAGELLLEFDAEAIEKEGYKTITPVIVTNSDQYAAVELSLGSVTAKRDTLLTLAAQEEDA
ncbi:PTS glucose transporter subunit IIA [Agathobaculum sp. NSJ-28]|uniref:PTS glucose transporter subunit IIA n=2 Tax=Agathobaculum TaxID=2048137 RepID=A0A923LTX6_9FIRM|nr:PTS transporter subunit IIBCA [Agathobaculum ammoniilyticum]MBC5723907.1 PTS glucose transporter subunit IIA [Agathobaculum faecis]MBS6882770.1 glucose PTS transporter subunit IIA [Clostridiaceae bacterium]MCU6787528.1 glucose PTS transporter subunit IIA [Agathobaculum ammoniilyticum]SCI37928.1 EIIBCA-Bgl [uncultured Butyricicoccus sp.]